MTRPRSGLLLTRGAAVNARQVEGRTPLYLAASLGDGVAILKRLLEQGADPRLTTANGMTPLMAAAGAGTSRRFARSST